MAPQLQMNVTQFLVDEAEVGEWNLDGLPTDELSVQNGIMVTRASRYPILVDPQGQGKAWIRKRESKNDVKVTTLTDKYFRQWCVSSSPLRPCVACFTFSLSSHTPSRPKRPLQGLKVPSLVSWVQAGGVHVGWQASPN